MPNIRSTKVLLDLLKKKTVVELKDIRTSLGEVSSMTASVFFIGKACTSR